MKKQKIIEYRRQKVGELLVQGLSQYDIAAELRVSQPTVSRDVEYLEGVARQDLQKHIDRKMPLVHIQVMQGIEQVIKSGWQVVKEAKNQYIKVHALNLIHTAYITKSNLSTGTGVVTDSIKLINKSKDELEQIKEPTSEQLDAAKEESETTNLEPNEETSEEQLF